MLPVFINHTDKAIDKLVDAADATDIQDLASKFTLDAATEFLFGSCVHSLQEELPRPWNVLSAPAAPSPLTPTSTARAEKPATTTLLPTHAQSPSNETPSSSSTSAFPAAFTSALHTLAARLRSGALWPLLEITRDSTKKDVQVIRGFVRGLVQSALERREEKERGGEEDNEKGTLLDHLVTVSDGKQKIMLGMLGG